MKRLLYPGLIISVLCLIHCTPGSELDINFIEHPNGGKNITLLSCTFEGKLLAGSSPINVSIEWWSTDSTGSNEQIHQQEDHTFESVSAEQVLTEYAAPTSDVLEGYYWVRVEWNEDNGTAYYEESQQAFCYEGPNNR